MSGVDGVAVADGFRHRSGASVYALSGFPLPAHRTRRADFPHWVRILGKCCAERFSVPASGAAIEAAPGRPAPVPPFTSRCDAIWRLRTQGRAYRLAPVPAIPASLPRSFSHQGPLSRPASHGFLGTTCVLATLPTPAAPREFPVGSCVPPTVLSVSVLRSSCTYAAIHSSTEPPRPSFVALPRGVSVRWQPSPIRQRVNLHVKLSEACFPAEPPLAAVVPPKCLRPCRYIHRPLRWLPTGTIVAGWNLHRLDRSALVPGTPHMRFGTQLSWEEYCRA